MKNTLYLLLLCAVVTFVGCQKDNVDVQPDETEIERSSDRAKKVKVCHCTYGDDGVQWEIRRVKKNKVRQHLRHGDFKMKDKDGDGFYQENPCVPAEEVDCDDWNCYVNPNCAEDPTNGIDDNCDGQIDEGGEVDADGDGFNSEEDCDDDNPAVHPDATEIPYNGLDDDCDGATLDDDLDGDGFVLANDCDDTNPELNVSCISCFLVEALELNDISISSQTGKQPFGSGFLYIISSEWIDADGNTLTGILGVVIVGDQYAYVGSYYKNDGTFVDIAPLVFDGPNPDRVEGTFDSLEEAAECAEVFETIIAPFAQ